MPCGEESALRINDEVGIPWAELSFRFSRSSGPGGQHVNRTETRVELVFDLAHTPRLSEDQRGRALRALTPYLDQNGVMHLVSQSTRSQARNRQEVLDRFQGLLRDALRVPKKRISTTPRRAAREKRLEEKRRRSDVKKRRGRVSPDSD